MQKYLTLEWAERIFEAAKTESKELEIKEDIAIVDAGGNLGTFARMERRQGRGSGR